MDKKKVNVLMSTYNGIKYIDEQIQSILNQKNVTVKIYIRDDGSTDGTYEYIEEKYPEIYIYQGENVGYKKSFIKLLNKVDTSGYYAFSDQDDVWDTNKLDIAIQKLEELDNSKPNLYCSNLRVTDENLNFIQLLHSPKEKIKISKECALVENLSYGCTTVFNKKARDLATIYSPNYTSHDGWINLICAFLGNTYYDDRAFISYRQHGNNILGGKRDFISVWKKRLKSFDIFNHYRDISADEFLKAYNTYLSKYDITLVQYVSEYRKSIKNKFILFTNTKIRMSTFDRDFWYRIRILLSSI